MAIIGFIGASEMVGVTSLCRFRGLGDKGYGMFLNFFKSSAWSLGNVVACGQAFVISQKKLVTIDGRVVLQGDHAYVPKDGQRMPGVVTPHQDSETQGKPSYFRGHCRGAVVGLAGLLLAPFGVPLNLGIHQGFVHIGRTASRGILTGQERICAGKRTPTFQQFGARTFRLVPFAKTRQSLDSGSPRALAGKTAILEKAAGGIENPFL